MPEIRKDRDLTIDLCRAIGIVLVAAGHSGCPDFLDRYIYMFHMALFFFLSGYCYKDRNDGCLKKYILSKIKTIYVPFVVCNGLFVLLHNVFLRLGIYTDNPEFLLLTTGTGYGLMPEYSVGDTLRELFRTVLFAGNEQMGGATWFLRILFILCVGHCASGALLRKLGWESRREVCCYILGALCLLIGGLLNRLNVVFPLDLQSVFAAYFAFSLGVLWKKRIENLLSGLNNWAALLLSAVCAALLFLMSREKTISLGSNQIVSVFFYGAGTVLGVTHIFCLSKAMAAWLQNRKAPSGIVSYVARNTMTVLLFHFLAFKAVTLGYLLITGLPFVALACFTVAAKNGWLWLLYTGAGVALPLLIKNAVQHCFKKGRMKTVG